jgi:Holliday junction DNA helicase RuvA
VISYLEGKLKRVHSDKVTLFVSGVGYDVLLPAYVMNEIKRGAKMEDQLSLHISYNQTERQPKPVLVGFKQELDKEFFELFISVEDIGPLAAIRALDRPIRDIARSIEEKDVKGLKQLKGIGERKAEKIIAALKGKVAKYALIPEAEPASGPARDFIEEVEYVMVNQLGHKMFEARKMIQEAMRKNPAISSTEELFEEVYRGYKK